MKDVTIISKVVGRKEGDRPVTGGGSQAAVDLSAYLLKKTWDTAWELREKDGVPYLFGKLPVVLQSGMTSYVADEAVDLPGIYDGLPIDNQTLKWVETTDENGAVSRVLVAAGGGGGTGGGSVQHRLYWEGFSSGSWDGSEEKTIEIPSKLSELENDGKFFADGGWIGSDANSVTFGSYLYGEFSNNTPRNVGQLLAFNNGDTDSWNRGSQIFIEGENFYYRQYWDNYWRNWRRVITGDVDGVLDSNLEIKGEEGGNIKFVYNSDSAITTNKPNDLASIRHALRFPWYGESYEIGTIRGNAAHSDGFGITHQNNHLVWKVNRERMDVYGDLRLKGGLIQYNEEGGYFYLEGNLVVSGGISSYVDVGNLNLPSIYDGLPIDKTTIGWKEVTDASGAKSKVLGIIGGIDDTVMWSDIEGIPSWIGNSKPSYSYSEISDTPDLTKYALKESIPSLSGYATIKWVNDQNYVTSSALDAYLPLNGELPSSMSNEFKLQGDLRLQKGTGASRRKILFGDGLNTYLYESPDNFLNIYAHNGMKIYTQATKYIELAGKGVKVNNGIITYNESGRYFELDGNLLVTGGITAFADSGAGNQWILDATALSSVTSTNKYKVYSANVTTMLAKKVTSLETKLSAIKDSLVGINGSSSLQAIGTALNSIYNAIK